MLCPSLKRSIRKPRRASKLQARALFLLRHCFVKELRSAQLDSPIGSPSFFGKANRAAQNLRRPSGHRHRERRLFKEIQERNAELREALEHQTATAEVLGIISRSPTDVQPVLDAIVESAARVCGIDDVVLRLHEGDTWIRGLILVPYPLPRRDEY